MKKELAPREMSRFLKVYKEKIKEMLTLNGFKDSDPSYGNIIRSLEKNEKLTMKELAESIDRDKSTLTVLIRKLEKSEVVKKIDNKEDFRSKYIVLTDKGHNYAKVFNKIAKEINDILWNNISDEEGVALMNTLQKLNNNIETY